MARDLYVTLAMLRREGIDANALFLPDQVVVFITDATRRRIAHRAAVRGPDRQERAANWLAAIVLLHYPRSDLSKLWRVVSSAAASARATPSLKHKGAAS